MIDLLKRLVEDNGVDVNAKDDRGMPPIIWAIRCERCIDMFVEFKSTIEMKSHNTIDDDCRRPRLSSFLFAQRLTAVAQTILRKKYMDSDRCLSG